MASFTVIPASGLTDMQANVYASIIYNSMPSHFADYFEVKDHTSIIAFMKDFKAGEGVGVLDFYINKVKEYCNALACTTAIVFDGDKREDDPLYIWWEFAKQGEHVATAWDAYMSLNSNTLEAFERQWKEALKASADPKDQGRGLAILKKLQKKAAKG